MATSVAVDIVEAEAAEAAEAAAEARARRNELVEEAVPLARLIVNTYCRDRGIFGLRDEIEAEALAGLMSLAATYRPESPWLKYVSRNLKYRLIDAMRRRSGRTNGKHYELRAGLIGTEALDVRLEVIGVRDPAFAEVETADAFASAARRLPERTRRIIERRLEGLKLDEIGVQLGISESRVSQILFEARPVIERVLAGR